jgi:sRNA-binding carbon storage regulator CsrA
MLIIKRKTAEIITIEPLDGLGNEQTVNELFSGGAIQITLLKVGSNWVKLAIDAPAPLRIWRGSSPAVEYLKIQKSLNGALSTVDRSKLTTQLRKG